MTTTPGPEAFDLGRRLGEDPVVTGHLMRFVGAIVEAVAPLIEQRTKEAAARLIERAEHDMADVQGESPRGPDEPGERHYAGVRHGLREAARIVRGEGA